ncbi:MAG: VWA domain-containing protein [Deltaproteobacteria bacterium]
MMSGQHPKDISPRGTSRIQAGRERESDRNSGSVLQDSMAGAVISFGRLLKEHGFAVSTPSMMDALSGITSIGLESVRDFHTLLGATFMSRSEERALFDRLFQEFWLKGNAVGTEAQGAAVEPDASTLPEDTADFGLTAAFAETAASVSEEEEAWGSRPYVIYSPQERLRDTDFRDIPREADRETARLIREILSPLLRRIGTRRHPASSGMSPDFRRVLRKNLRYGGELLEIPRLRRKLRIKRLVFLCDVSGSMNPYLRFMLRFIKELQDLPTRVETFVFATRLTRVTHLLLRLPFGRAMNEVARKVRDWSGGTRIGSCLYRFTSEYGDAMLRPSTVLLIHSDGWDRGDIELLEREMERIHRRVYRVLWINPLLGGPSYEPTCRGMTASLPYIDSFLPGHSIAGLERVAGTLRGLF